MTPPGRELVARHDAVAGEFTVRCGGVEVARYAYRHEVPQLEAPRPFLHPVRTLAGHLVSGYRPADHVWHRGIAWSLPHLGHENFWGGPTFVRGEGYVQLPNDGSVDTVAVRTATEGSPADGVARFAHDLAWTTQSGRLVVREHRELTVRDAGPAWVLTSSSAMTNVGGAPTAIGSPATAGRSDAGYGGFFWRGPLSFRGGDVVTADRVGGDDQRGRTAEWMAFCGRHDDADATSTVLLLDAADNPRHPPPWFARSEEYPGLCPAPFAVEELPFAAGATLRFRHAVVVADGVSDPARGASLAGHGRRALAAEA
ncbi:hypothetical protein GTR02_02260 [Kineococcus sp. R8]|uniref:DUF6807 family protein n=1 Tax=Kineococcus siccus TaxID=2696567 RepID=UPI0014136C28|nr:hypothetical protein [Kineococcus siccus]